MLIKQLVEALQDPTDTLYGSIDSATLAELKAIVDCLTDNRPLVTILPQVRGYIALCGAWGINPARALSELQRIVAEGGVRHG